MILADIGGSMFSSVRLRKPIYDEMVASRAGLLLRVQGEIYRAAEVAFPRGR